MIGITDPATLDGVIVHVATDPQPDVRLLGPGEVARASRFAHRDDRERFIRRRSELRRVLSAQSGIDPQSLVFSHTKEGKPFLNGSPLRFSTASTHGSVAIAIAVDREVGIDIVRLEPGMYDESTAAVVCHPNELDQIRHASDPDRMFATLWARNEAFAKLDGRGLGDHTRDIDLSDRAHHTDVAFRLIDTDRLVVAVAVGAV